MNAVFLLPPIQGVPTGGNRFNEEVLRRLDPRRWRSVVWGAGQADWPWPETACVVVDSLLVADPPTCTAVKDRAGTRQKTLLAHYLPQCDPSVETPPPLPGGFDHYLVPSRFMAEGLRRAGVPERQITIVYPGIDRPPSPPLRLRRDPPVRLLTVASMLPVKGILEAIETLAPLSNRDWLWDIVGDTSRDTGYMDAVRRRLAAAGLEGRTRILGSRPPEDLPALYASADLLVAPSRFESLGMAIREAMAYGLPVVAYAVGGVPESVIHAQTGYLAPAGDGTAFRDAVSRLIVDEALRITLGDGARAASVWFPNWEAAASCFERHVGG